MTQTVFAVSSNDNYLVITPSYEKNGRRLMDNAAIKESQPDDHETANCQRGTTIFDLVSTTTEGCEMPSWYGMTVAGFKHCAL